MQDFEVTYHILDDKQVVMRINGQMETPVDPVFALETVFKRILDLEAEIEKLMRKIQSQETKQ